MTRDLSLLSDKELIALYHQTNNDISNYHNHQLAFKVGANSVYGAIGNQWFTFFDIDNAEAITTTGQLAIQFIGKRINEWFNKKLETEGLDLICASDTDSAYINLGPFVKKFCPSGLTLERQTDWVDKVCETFIQKVINDACDQLAEYLNAPKSYLVMKRESIAIKGFWTGKKRYALLVLDDEGVRLAKPKLKVVGLESQRASAPIPVRNKLKELYETILSKDEPDVHIMIDEFKKDFMTWEAELVSKPVGVSDVAKYYDKTLVHKKGAPRHVKAALVYNHVIKEMNLHKKYPTIYDGAKIRYWDLKLPNPFKSDTIAVLDDIPAEFELEKWIDRKKGFDVLFMKPAKATLEAVGWSHEARFSMEDFLA